MADSHFTSADEKVYLGSAYLSEVGGELVFYSTTVGTTKTLTQLAAATSASFASPTVTGDLTLSDGKITWTDNVDEAAGAFTFNNVTTDAITVNCNAMTSGSALRIVATEGTLNAGFYLECYDNTAGAIVLGIKEDGEIEITGVAASDMLTITAGNLQLDNGKFEVDTTQDITSYIKRNHATSANAVVEIEQTHAGATGSGLLIDQNATGSAICLELSHSGDLATIECAAGAARTGNVINVPMANQLAETVLDITGVATGTSGEGIIHVDVTGVLAGNPIRVDSTGANAATGQLLYLLSTGKQAGATEGICGYFQDTGDATATSYTVSISSTNNEALHVDAGQSLFDECVNITLADNTGPALAITNPDTTGNSNAVTITPSGTGAGLAISPQSTGGKGLLITTVASSTAPLVSLDATTGAGWIGAATTGCIDITADGALVADAALIRVASSGQPAAANDGICLEMIDTGAAQATSYVMRIASTNNEAIHVDSGKVLVDETVTATGGIITLYNEAINLTGTPTNAEFDTALGTNATAGTVAIVKDSGGTPVYLVASDGADNWYVALTKAL